MKRSDIVVARHKYLRKKRKLENNFSNSTTLSLDETFVHKNLISGKILVSPTESRLIRIPADKGSRFIILHLKMVG